MKSWVLFKIFLSRLWGNRDTLLLMIERDFRVRYVQSIGGILWAFVNPLLQVLTYTLIFSLIFGRTIGDTPFAIWLFSALIPWITFSEIIRNSVTVIERNKSLVTKSPFPSELLPFIIIGSSLANHMASLMVLMVLLTFWASGVGIQALWVVFYLFCLIGFALGISWILASISVFIRDIGQIISVVIQLWFYLCPIIYPETLIPERYTIFMKLNPMYFIVQGYRNALIYNKGIHWPDFFIFAVWFTLSLVLGGWLFLRLKTHFAEVL